MKKKYPDSLIKEAHFLAFSGEIPNEDIAKYLRLTKNELKYVLYTLKPKPTIDEMYIEQFEQDIERNYKLLKKEKELTITESFLDFFTLEEYKWLLLNK